MKKIRWVLLIVTFLFVHMAAGIGSLATNADTAWYDSIKPAITPPNYVFPIVWTALFILIWLALYSALVNTGNRKQKMKIWLGFGLNLLLNILWSLIFFFQQNPSLALYDIFLLLISILMIMIIARRSSRASFWMLLPYLIWVSFATVLNYLIVFG